MALIWADGFDHWGSVAAARDCYSTIGNSFSFVAGRTASCLRMTSYSQTLVRSLVLADEIVFGAAVYLEGPADTSSQYQPVICFVGPGIGAQLNNNYGVQIIHMTGINQGGPIKATSSPNLWAVGTWFYIEAKAKRNGANYDVAVRLNGSTILEYSGAFTNAQISALQVSQSFADMRLDDFYICDATGAINNTFLGDRRMRTLKPVADVAGEQDWTPNTGTSGYTQIDDVPAASNYIQATAAGDVSKFEIGPDLPANTSNIAALVIFQRAIKSDNGTATVVAGLENANGTYSAPAFNPLDTAAAYQINPAIAELDGGGYYWDYNTVNNTKLTVTRTA